MYIFVFIESVHYFHVVICEKKSLIFSPLVFVTGSSKLSAILWISAFPILASGLLSVSGNYFC